MDPENMVIRTDIIDNGDDPLRTVITAIVDEMEEMKAEIGQLQQAVVQLSSQLVLLDHKVSNGA